MTISEITADTDISELLDFKELQDKWDTLGIGLLNDLKIKNDSFHNLIIPQDGNNGGKTMHIDDVDFDETAQNLLNKYSMLNWEVETVRDNIFSYVASQSKQEFLKMQEKLYSAIDSMKKAITKVNNDYDEVTDKTFTVRSQYMGQISSIRSALNRYEEKLETVNEKLRGISSFESTYYSYNPGKLVMNDSAQDLLSFVRFNNGAEVWTEENSENGLQVSYHDSPTLNRKITRYMKDGKLVYYKIENIAGVTCYDCSGRKIDSEIDCNNLTVAANFGSNSNDYTAVQVKSNPVFNNNVKGFSDNYYNCSKKIGNKTYNCGVVTTGGANGNVKMYIINGKGYYDSNYRYMTEDEAQAVCDSLDIDLPPAGLPSQITGGYDSGYSWTQG